MQWAGEKAQSLTSPQSGTGSSSAKSNDPILTKLNEVLKERDKLREEIELLRASLNKHYDV